MGLYNPHQDPALPWLLPATVTAKLNPASGIIVPEEQAHNHLNTYDSVILLYIFKDEFNFCSFPQYIYL